MADRSPPPRGKLLVSVALSATTMWFGCGSDRDREPVGNPKGSHYGEGGSNEIPPPGNPKGSLYDQTAMPTADASASAAPTAEIATSASAAPSASSPPPPATATTGKK
jgi:hypothetical protein